MKNLIGVMQGRLLPKYKGRYQAHPKNYWQEEFYIARDLKLNCIEFILDYEDAQDNPLLKKNGVGEILSISNDTGIAVNTICADYFMEAPLHSNDVLVAENSLNVLNKLLETSNKLNVTDIVIPCVDQSTLSNNESVSIFIERIGPVIKKAEKYGINLSLETDLSPQSFVDLIKRIDSEIVTVNYDIGNSASLGYSAIEELNAYGDKITDIHIKDRSFNGGPVMLGDGNADFSLFFSELKKINYKGPFIMQAYRDDEGLQVFKKQLKWVKKYLNAFY